MVITKKVLRFIEEYIVDLNGAAAAKRAGYSAKTGKVQACNLLKDPDVRELIDIAIAERSARTQITADMVLHRLWQMATADPNELVQYRRSCCRYCYGVDHKYQWTQGHYLKRCSEAKENKTEPPELAGGFGFDPNKQPASDCPECFGDGYGHVFVTDTRDIHGAALTIYAGVKQGKEGLELKLVDQTAPLVKVGEHLGMFKQRHEHSAPGGGPIQQSTVTTNMTPEQFQEIAKKIVDEY